MIIIIINEQINVAFSNNRQLLVLDSLLRGITSLVLATAWLLVLITIMWSTQLMKNYRKRHFI